jgi:Uri superfamily endonuclease
MRKGKVVHWHVDQLTERGSVTGSWIARDGQECDLVATLGPLPMPIPGFGSSDCVRCRSHLLYSPVAVSIFGRHSHILKDDNAEGRQK